MASHFGGYNSTTKTYNHKKYGVYGDYKKVWYNFEYEITISGSGTISYKITSTSNIDDIMGWSGCKVSAWIEIAGKTVLDAAWHSSGFPWKDGSTLSGTLSTTSASITIKSKIIPGSNYTGWTDEWNESLSSTTMTRSSWTWYDNTAGKAPKITDGGNNKFSITGYAGTAGSNNSITETKLQYKLGNGSWTTATGNSLSATAITAAKGDGFQTVTARTRYKCQRYSGDSSYIYSSEATLDVKNYQNPSNPSNINIGYTKNRFTIKENWNITWSRGTQANDSSPIEGYRIRIYKGANTIPIKDSSGTIIASETSKGNKDYCYDFENPAWTIVQYVVADDDERDSIIPANKVASYDFNGNGRLDAGDSVYVQTNNLDTTFTIDPVQNGFVAGDTVKIMLHAYTRNGLGSKLWSSGVYSSVFTVQNAGVMRVKTSSGWKEGQVYVKVDGGWKEADVVKVKTSAGWKESE